VTLNHEKDSNQGLAEYSADRKLEFRRRIRAAGWEQGDLLQLYANSLWWSGLSNSSERELVARSTSFPLAEEWVVVVTQTCDLVQDFDREPFVEVARIIRQPDPAVRATYQRSPRWFEIDESLDLVVVNNAKFLLDKGYVASHAPRKWPGSQEKLGQFRLWLGRRYARVAFGDSLVEGFISPLSKAIRKINSRKGDERDRLASLLEELRVEVIDQTSDVVSVVLHCLVSTTAFSRTNADFLDEFIKRIYQCVNENQVDLADVKIWTRERMSVSTYLDSQHIDRDDQSISRSGSETSVSIPLF